MYSLEEFKKLSSKKKEDQVYGPSKDDVLYQKYLESKPQKAWRDEAIERLTPKALTPPTQAGPTYLEKLAENREKAKQLSARVPETATAAGNIREMIFGKPIEAGTVNPRISAADFSTRYDSMTDREKAAYTYLKNTDAKKADEYLKAIEMDINARNAEKRVADAKKIAEESTAAGLYERFMGNNIVSNGAATAYELWQGLRNQPVDPNHPLLAGQDIVKGQNEVFVGDSTGIERYLREGAMGAFDFGTNLMTAGAVGLRGQALQNMVKGSFAAQAFAGAAHDAAEREGTGMQSVMTGTASAALATIIEGIGLDRLAEIGKLANARGVLKSMARSILPEAAEEAVEEAGNILADAVIMGDKNEIVGLYNTARANGATQNDAMMAAIGQAGKQIGESAIIGGISGGLIGGGVAMTNRALGGNVLENDVPDTNVGETEQLNTATPQNPVTSHETAISDELTNSFPATETLPTEAQTKQARDRDSYLEKYYHENGANILRAEAENRGSLQEAEDIYRPYYTAGLTGQAFDSVKGAMAVNADRSVAMEMYQAGVNDKAADMTARIKGQDKLRRSNTGVNLMTEAITDQQKALANLVAKVGRMNVTIVDTLGKNMKVGNNGEYTRGTNEVVIALDAESFSGTLFHETVHYIKQANAKGYERMAEAVFRMAAETDGVSVSDYLRRYESIEAYGPAIEAGAYNFADVTEELVADAFQMLAADEARCRSLIAELKQNDPTILEQIKEFLQKMLETLEGLVKDGRFHAFAEDINKDIENTKKLQKIFAEELREAGRTAETKKQPAEQSTLEKVGVQIDTATQSAAPKMSLRTWSESDYAKDKGKAAKALAKAMDISVEKSTKWIDDINGVAKIIADDRERLDYEANLDDAATVLKSNQEYKWTLDMSTLCAKRLWFTGTFDAIQKAMPDTAFTSEEITRIRTMMQEKGYEVACGICYVESTRREIGPITQMFIDQYKKAQKTGKPIARVNFQGKESELTSKGRVFYAEEGYTPTLADLNTTDIDLVKRDHPDVYAAYLAFMNARGQAKPKLLETRAEYKGEIPKTFRSKTAVKSRNDAGGLRVQSFSDFEVPHMIDMMQAVMDMAKVGLQAQAYTKVPEFAAVFGGTGMKINLSLIAKGDGVDSKGRLIFDDVEGIDHKKAFKLREQYSENVGTILVGKNDKHIIAAMADPKIDFIIPFHKSSWKESLYDALGLTGYGDYTATQNEKPIDKSRKIKNFDPSEYWDFSKSGDENAQIYLQKCREDGRIPKFPEFSTYPGYWKLLIDFKMYDNDGVGSPQMEVQPEFNMKEARKILKAYEGGHRSFPVAQDVVDEFVAEKQKKKFSAREKDAEYMTAVESGDMAKAEQMVREAAERAMPRSKIRTEDGKLRKVYHGTNEETFTEFEDKFIGMASGDDGYFGRGHYFAFDKREAWYYGNKRIIEAFLDVKKPFNFETELRMYKGKKPKTSEALDGIALMNFADKFPDIAKDTAVNVLKKGDDEYERISVQEFSEELKNVIANKEFQQKETTNDWGGLGTIVYADEEEYRYEYNGEVETYKGYGWEKEFYGKVEDLDIAWFYMSDGVYEDIDIPSLTRVVLDNSFAFTEELKRRGYDGTIQSESGDEVVAFYSSQIKSAEPWVYDDNGDVIPLSERFNPEKTDIRWSVRESGEAELRRENASLISENKHLQKLNENLKKQFKLTDGKSPDPKAVKRVAKDWLKQIQSKADVEDFSMKLGKITEYFAKAEDKNDHDHAMAALRVLVREAMEEAETLNTDMRDSYSDLISRIKDTTLKVTEAVREELEYYGGYNSFRREHFSSMTLNSQKGASIDSFYNELCSDYPEFFKEEDAISEGEQLMRISEVLDTLKPVAENPYGYYIDEYVYDETMGLLDKMADIQMEQTFADKKKAEKTAAMQKLKAEFRTTMDAMRNEVKTAQEEAEKAYVAGRMVEGRNKAKEIARLEAKHLRLKERNKKAADNRKARADRRIIEKEAKAMLEWLANPTDTKHVPEALKKHTAYLLTMFTTGKDDRLTNLQLVVSKLAEEYRKLDPDDKRNEDMTGRYIEYDDNLTLIAEALEESLKKRADGLISLNNLTAEEMGDLKDMIRMLKKTLMEANKLVTMDKRAEVANVSEDIIADMQPRKNAVQTGKLRVLNDFFKLDMLDANSFFKRMSNTAYATIYRSFRKGLDTKIRCVKEAADFMNELVDKKTVKQWRDTAPEKIELMGGTVYLNIPQIMSVYCLSRREQGKQHLYTGGVVGDTDYQKKRLSKETLEAMKQVTGSQLTEADVKQITDRLTAEQKHVAREMQKFLSENAAKWGNDVTMQLFGYKKFNEQNYFPIKVDGDTTMVTVGKPKDATRSLRSLGMTKQLKKNAQNPVMARDIFTVFAEHIDQMSSYAAFVPVISDTNKILNYKTEGGASVKKELRRVMGDGGIGYIHKLVDMINGAVAYSNDGAFAKAMVRNMKIASVGFNARVVAQQPTSIVRASVVIKPQYIAASVIPTKKDWENIYRYAPISWWKEQGYYDVNIGKSIEGLMTGSTGMEKVTDASMWAAGKADKFTWGWMWKAAEKQIRKEQPGLTGDAFYEAVGELFSRAIDETQVVDSPLHRSQKMREKGLFTQMTTSFMSEPTKTYNMATTAMMNLMRENTPENRKQFARTLWWLTASAAATAAAAAVVDAGRDDDDDEKWADKWLAAFRGDYSEAETKGDMAKAFFGSNFGSNVNPMNYIPYMKDLMSIFDGYDIRRTDMDWAVDIKNAMNRLHKYAEGDSEYTAYATFTYVAGAFSKVFGVPMKSIMRDMEAMVNWANIHLIGTEEAKYENSRRTLAVGSKKNMSYYTERYLKAYQNGDKALAQKIYNDMINGGVDEEELKQKIASNVNDMMFDAHVMGNDSEFRKFWNEQNGRGKEDSSLRTSMRSRYETMYKNAVKNGDSEAQREAKAGFMEFGGKETTLDKYH